MVDVNECFVDLCYNFCGWFCVGWLILVELYLDCVVEGWCVL